MLRWLDFAGRVCCLNSTQRWRWRSRTPTPQALIQHHVTGGILDDAGQLALRHQLKSLDTIHLASALTLRLLSATAPLVFMTFDLKLSRAAAAEGLSVWPPPPRPDLPEPETLNGLSCWPPPTRSARPLRAVLANRHGLTPAREVRRS